MSNILLNKRISASHSFAPFTADKAIDGIISADSRWLTTDVNTYPYLLIDLEGSYWVNQWFVSFLSNLNGWYSGYSVTGIELLGSADNITWGAMYIAENNTLSQINVSLPPTLVRYLKIVILSGSTANKALASIVDMQAYELPNAPFLSSLTPSSGTLSPAFASRTLNYTINVPASQYNIAFTPTATQNGMTIKVDGVSVNSGSQSPLINLAAGNNTVRVDVTYNMVTTSYKIIVNKANVDPSYLSGLSVMDNYGNEVQLEPMFTASVLNYSIYVDGSIESVSVTPSAPNPSSVIKVNGAIVASNSPSGQIPVPTPISIVIDGATTYTIGYM